MNLASCEPSAMVTDLRGLTINPVDSPISDLVIMAQADYAIALGNNLIAGILIGLGIATIVWVIGLTVYNAIQNNRDPRAQAFRRHNAEIKAWRKRRDSILRDLKV